MVLRLKAGIKGPRDARKDTCVGSSQIGGRLPRETLSNAFEPFGMRARTFARTRLIHRPRSEGDLTFWLFGHADFCGHWQRQGSATFKTQSEG